jgi:hypothetical protein
MKSKAVNNVVNSHVISKLISHIILNHPRQFVLNSETKRINFNKSNLRARRNIIKNVIDRNELQVNDKLATIIVSSVIQNNLSVFKKDKGRIPFLRKSHDSRAKFIRKQLFKA